MKRKSPIDAWTDGRRAAALAVVIIGGGAYALIVLGFAIAEWVGL